MMLSDCDTYNFAANYIFYRSMVRGYPSNKCAWASAEILCGAKAASV